MKCTYEKCNQGHICTSGCQKDFDCPCLSEHEMVDENNLHVKAGLGEAGENNEGEQLYIGTDKQWQSLKN